MQSSSPVLQKQVLDTHRGEDSVSFHVESEGTGQLFWVTQKEIVHASPLATNPSEWLFENTSAQVLNFASDYASGSGLYVASFDLI